MNKPANFNFKIDYDSCPVDYMASGLENYVERGLEPGSFMSSLLKNDLIGAFQDADIVNSEHIKEWVVWLIENLQPHMWGTPEAYYTWIERNRFNKN